MIPSLDDVHRIRRPPATRLIVFLRESFRPGSVQRSASGAVAAGLTGQLALVVSGIALARVLGPQARGSLALLLLLPAVVYQAGNLGLPLACAYYLAQEPRRSRAIVRRLRTIGPLQAVLLGGIHALAIAIVIWSRSPELRLAALITLPSTSAQLMQDYGLAILQGLRGFRAFNILRTLPSVANAVVGVILFGLQLRNLVWVVAILIVPGICISAFTLAFAIARSRNNSPLGEAGPTLRQLIRFGAKGVLGSSYPVETFRADQLIVGLFLSATDLGRYVVALSFVNLPRFISQSIGFIAYPHVAAELQLKSQRRAMWRFFWVTTALTVMTVLVLELLVPILLPILFGSQFTESVPIARVLLVAAAFFSARRILAEVMKGAGNPAAGSIAELASFVALIPAFLLFTRSFHVIGVAVALTFSAALSLAVLILLDLKATRRQDSRRWRQNAK
ncbi:MAG: hypothetical protein DMF54_11940 [Acidobacteria bacterium]|nr:MAG: hypothetical protein DMF54_11940 [Acidobacteriota bacterium]